MTRCDRAALCTLSGVTAVTCYTNASGAALSGYLWLFAGNLSAIYQLSIGYLWLSMAIYGYLSPNDGFLICGYLWLSMAICWLSIGYLSAIYRLSIGYLLAICLILLPFSYIFIF